MSSSIEKLFFIASSKDSIVLLEQSLDLAGNLNNQMESFDGIQSLELKDINFNFAYMLFYSI